MLSEIGNRIWLLAPQVPRYPYGNCLYIEDELPTVIDLGAGGNTFKDIPCDQVKLGLISHFHFDHVHGTSFFPQAQFMAGEEERLTYVDQQEYINFHGYNLWDDLMPGIKRELYGNVVILPEDVPIQPGFRVIPMARNFKDMEEINIGRTKIKAIHLPGHTAGHYGFYFAQENILFSGDIDLVRTGPWYNSNSGSVGDLIASVQRIKEINPRIVVPSHRRIQTKDIPAQLDAYIQVVLDREAKIYDYLQRPHNIADLAEYRLTYPRQLNDYEEFWEKMTIRNHLQHLMELGSVTEIEPGIYIRI